MTWSFLILFSKSAWSHTSKTQNTSHNRTISSVRCTLLPKSSHNTRQQECSLEAKIPSMMIAADSLRKLSKNRINIVNTRRRRQNCWSSNSFRMDSFSSTWRTVLITIVNKQQNRYKTHLENSLILDLSMNYIIRYHPLQQNRLFSPFFNSTFSSSVFSLGWPTFLAVIRSDFRLSVVSGALKSKSSSLAFFLLTCCSKLMSSISEKNMDSILLPFMAEVS